MESHKSDPSYGNIRKTLTLIIYIFYIMAERLSLGMLCVCINQFHFPGTSMQALGFLDEFLAQGMKTKTRLASASRLASFFSLTFSFLLSSFLLHHISARVSFFCVCMCRGF